MQFNEIEVGQTATASHVVSEEAVIDFAKTSGDFNPIHLDEEYAKDSYFGKKLAHGMFSASLFSGIFGTQIPGPGCLYVGQNLRFRRPVFIGDVVNAVVEVTDIDREKRIVTFDTKCLVNDTIVIFGTAELFVPAQQI